MAPSPTSSSHVAVGVPARPKRPPSPLFKLGCGVVTFLVVIGAALGVYAAAAGQVWLLNDEQVVLTSPIHKYVANGPGTIRFNPFEFAPEKRKAVVLSELEYVRVTDTITGMITSVSGPALYFPGAWDEVSEKQEAYLLLRNEYLKLVDGPTGVVRVVSGEQRVFPNAMESLHQEVSEAIHVDDDTSALVLSKENGQQRLVTEQGLFFPGPYEEVLEARDLILVEPHEVAITRDVQGTYTFFNGSAGGRGTSFFLPPHNELVTMHWSDDAMDGETSEVTKIDLRSQYAFFTYTVRTADNVELVLEGTIFWEISDVPKMIEATADPKGDVWFHARSALIQAAAGATLEEFMAGFNELVTEATTTDVSFYEDRGVKLHSLELTSYSCKDEYQETILQEIIAETTNRINALQKQRSENDVETEKLAAELTLELARQDLVTATTDNERVQALADQRSINEVDLEKVLAEIALEQSRQELLAIKADNDRVEATTEGEAEGLRRALSMARFYAALNETAIDSAERIALYKFLSEQEAATEQLETSTKNLGSGKATLFLTPADMNLRFNVPALGGASEVDSYSYGGDARQ